VYLFISTFSRWDDRVCLVDFQPTGMVFCDLLVSTHMYFYDLLVSVRVYSYILWLELAGHQ